MTLGCSRSRTNHFPEVVVGDSCFFSAIGVITDVTTANLMVLELKLRKVGNSVGVVLPKEALSYLKVGEGDMLCVTEAPEGSLRISPAKADFNLQMQAAQDVVARYRNTLRELAK
jgi:putative addiction module antidote